MGTKRVTLKDIAAHVGLSSGTISRALADHPDISDETKNRVRDAAQAMSYIPNYRAKYLRAKHSRLIALIVPEMNMFFVPSRRIELMRWRWSPNTPAMRVWPRSMR